MAEFFTSYARADDSNKLVKKFVESVEQKVGSLTNLPVGRIAFIDIRDIKTGNEWREILAEPLKVAKVFVCMVSPTYVTRPVCSKEFAAFVERYERWKEDGEPTWKAANPTAKNPPSFIITLEWEKFLFEKPPAALSQFQTSDAAFPEDYKTYGLRDFLMFKKPRTKAYVDLVKAVATLIAEAIKAVPPIPQGEEAPDFDATEDLFQAAAQPAPMPLAEAIATIPQAAVPGKVAHSEVEKQAADSGIKFDVPPVLVSQPGDQP